MKRRRSDLTFTLFPFLAVLMCTMGALVLLLLVTTRQLRERTLAQHAQNVLTRALPTESATPFAPVLPVPVVPEPPPANSVHPADEPGLLPILAPEPPKGPSPAELARQAYAAERAEREAALSRLRQQWSQRLAELQQQRDRQLSAIQDGKQILNSQRARHDDYQRKLQSLEQQQAALQREMQLGKSREQALSEEQQRAQALLQQLQSKAAELKAQAANQTPRLSIVTHDGRSGTRRRPILIECRADGVTFASEQITLTSQDLTGFTPDYNPLKAGVEALLKHWARHEPTASKDEAPYVLLVVRPEGTVAFYVAQMLLAKVDCEHGYELILQQDEMVWPPADPVAANACRAEVERVLADRERLLRQVRGGRLPVSSELNFAGTNGEFRMQEVDRMRNIRDPYAIANSDWISPNRRRVEEGRSGAYGQRVFQPRPGAQGHASGSNQSDVGGTGFDSDSSRNQSSREFGGAARQFDSTGAPIQRGSADNVRPHPGFTTAERGPSSAGTFGDSTTTATNSAGPGANGGQIVPPAPDAASHGNASHSNASRGNAPQGGGRSERPSELDQLLRNAQNNSGASAADGAANQSGQSGQGSGSTAGGSAAGGGPPGAGAQAQDRWAEDGGAQKQWGGPARSNAIGLERDVVLDVWGDAIALEDSEQRISISPTSSRQELQQQISGLVEAQIRGWGPAPAAFVWRPTLMLRVHPGGNLHTGRIGELAKHWGFRVRTEFILE